MTVSVLGHPSPVGPGVAQLDSIVVDIKIKGAPGSSFKNDQGRNRHTSIPPSIGRQIAGPVASGKRRLCAKKQILAALARKFQKEDGSKEQFSPALRDPFRRELM